MVQLMRTLGEKTAVKLEADNCLEDQLSPPLHKRSKLDSSNLQRPDGDGGVMYNDSKNPLEEPSPLGLRLKKSPSFLDLIQMKLSQQNTSISTAMLSKKKTTTTNTTTTSSSASVADKLKASNFPASLLKIGTWEYKSRYEGDLVAKCYFAKHKLVWEVLDGGLKNKIEIQWSDIVAIKATFSSEGPETLDVVLARQPLFFRETNPQPRKHTLWQATSDFTGGQASIHRQHFLQCQHGLMGKHFEKLIQCDPRLNFLSQQQEILLESPYFEQRVPAFGDLNESSEGLDPKPEDRSAVFALQDAGPPSGALSSSLNIECQGFMCRTPENILQETPSPSFEIRSSRTDEQKLPNHWDQIKVHGIHSSMSMSDLVNHIGHCISEQMTSGNPALSGGEIESDDILEEVTQYLLGDTQHASALDEQSLMSRVNSLCCLLQKDPGTVRDLQAKSHSHLLADSDGRTEVRNSTTGSASQRKSVEGFPAPASQSNNISSCKQAPAMSRKDSVGDLLLNLPRIASLPRFLFNI